MTMASVGEAMSHSPFGGEIRASKSIPILLSTAALAPLSASDHMDIQQPAPGPMGPPTISPNGDRHVGQTAPQDHDGQINGSSVSAAAAAQQPKLVQTAFIHKLYSMLEDPAIRHLISWSGTNESFVMSPSAEFSKVLAQYFKHTNVSSFVRQLNMYGFHKVSDVFQQGSPDAPLWEFKHGNGSFRRGDLVGLREIKRRASRHALIHRESFSHPPKMPIPQITGVPGTPMEPMPDLIESRVNLLEWNNQDLYNRLFRTEEAFAAAKSRFQTITEGILRCYQWNNDLSSHLLTLVPDPDNPVHRDVFAMRQDINKHIDQMRSLEDPQESNMSRRPSLLSGALHLDPSLPMSPRQQGFDESRRPSLQSLSRASSFRAPVLPHLTVSPRRYGSIGTGSGAYSPSSSRSNYPPPPPPPPPHQQHPLASMTSPPSNLSRRHTSADIRLQGWQGGQPLGQYAHGSSPYASGQSSSAWPSSPRATAQHGDQQIQDALARYELPRASQTGSRQPSPPPPHDSGPPTFTSSFTNSFGNGNDSGWQLPGARYPFKGLDASLPPTRRSSMASNVHSLLNPAETVEREGEDEGQEERKRKRLL